MHNVCWGITFGPSALPGPAGSAGHIKRWIIPSQVFLLFFSPPAVAAQPTNQRQPKPCGTCAAFSTSLIRNRLFSV